MNTILRTPEFDAWLKALRDPIGKARIIARIRSAEYGNFGDCEPVAAGVSEMRIHCGPGYRVYYSRKAKIVYLLLCGGDKATQKRDIKQAQQLLKEPLIYFLIVIPANAGIQEINYMDSGIRRNDELIRASLRVSRVES